MLRHGEENFHLVIPVPVNRRLQQSYSSSERDRLAVYDVVSLMFQGI